MIELIWIAIIALYGIGAPWVGCYLGAKARRSTAMRAFEDICQDVGSQVGQIEGKLAAEIANREALEAKLATLEAAPIMIHPVFREMLYQWMQERSAMEHDPEFIIRSQGGGHGHNRPDGS